MPNLDRQRKPPCLVNVSAYRPVLEYTGNVFEYYDKGAGYIYSDSCYRLKVQFGSILMGRWIMTGMGERCTHPRMKKIISGSSHIF
jgi:hypothetical protein